MAVFSHGSRKKESPIEKILHDRRLTYAAWALILVECICAFHFIRPTQPFGDSIHYLQLADNLREGHYGTITAAGFEPDPTRPPGYPIVLWFLQYAVGLSHAGVIAIQIAAYAATLMAIQLYLSSRRLSPNVFLLLAAAYPFPLIYSAYLFSEAWTILLMTTSVLLIGLRPQFWTYAAAGALAALAGLFRSDLALLPLVFSATIALREFCARAPRLPATARVLAPLLAAALVNLPYAMWNYDKFGAFTPLPRAGAVGTSLYLSTWERQLSWEDFQAAIRNQEKPGTPAAQMVQRIQALNREIGAPEHIVAFDPGAYPTAKLKIAASKAFVKAAQERIAGNPLAYAKHVVLNTWELWVTKRYPADVPLPAQYGLKIISWLVFLGGIAGMALALVRRSDSPLPWMLVPATLYPAGLHIWLHTEARYTASARVLLVLFAASFASWLLAKYARRRFTPVT